MSQTEFKKAQITFDEKNDIVTIGKKSFQIQRKNKWRVVERITTELAVLRDKGANGIASEMTEMAHRADRWVMDVFENFLIDFDVSCLDDIEAEDDIVNLTAGRIYWAVRNKIPFLAIQSVDLSEVDKSKT